MVRRFAVLTTVLLMVFLFAGSVVPAQDKRDITIVNKAGEPITEIYIALANESEWGEDVLGQDVLEDGQTVDIHFSGYGKKDCQFDLLAKNEDGDQWLLEDLNLCEVTTVTITGKYIKAK